MELLANLQKSLDRVLSSYKGFDLVELDVNSFCKHSKIVQNV